MTGLGAAWVTVNVHTEPLFKKSKILPLPSLVQFFKLQNMHQFTLNALPQSFSSTVHGYETQTEETKTSPSFVTTLNSLFPPADYHPVIFFQLLIFLVLGVNFQTIRSKQQKPKMNLNLS